MEKESGRITFAMQEYGYKIFNVVRLIVFLVNGKCINVPLSELSNMIHSIHKWTRFTLSFYLLSMNFKCVTGVFCQTLIHWINKKKRRDKPELFRVDGSCKLLIDLTRPLSSHWTLYQRIGESCSQIRFIDKEETVKKRFPFFDFLKIKSSPLFLEFVLLSLIWYLFISDHFFLRIISSVFAGNHYILIVDWLCTISPCRIGRLLFNSPLIGRILFPSVNWQLF